MLKRKINQRARVTSKPQSKRGPKRFDYSPDLDQVAQKIIELGGLRGLAEGQKIKYELVRDARSGKTSADQLQIQA
jgi:hypothetical protein